MKRTTVICVLVVLLPCAAPQGLSWSRVQTSDASQPAARGGFAFGYDGIGNKLVIFGGFTADGVANDTWIFDITSGNWSEVQLMQAPSARALAYYGVVRVPGPRSLFVVALGLRSVTTEFDDVWVFDFTTMQWSRIDPQGDGPGARYGGHFGAAYGDTNTLWIGSGFTETTPLQTRYIDTYKLTFTSATEATWERVYPQPSIGNQFMPLSPHGRCLQTSTVIANAGLVMAGGCMRGGTGGGPCPTDDTWYFNDDSNEWEDLNRCITPRTWGGMAPLSNNSGKALLYGGNDRFSKQLLYVSSPYPQDEVFVVDVNGREKTWKRYSIDSSEYPDRRFRFGMAAAPNGWIYMFGGQNLSNNAFLDDMWVLSGDIDQTQEVSCNNRWFSYAHFHGLLMYLAFGLLFPVGIIVASSCKHSKGGFIAHVTIQITAALLAVAAFIMIFAVSERAGQRPTHPHAIIGIFLMFFMLLQPINGIFRPHIKEGKEKTKYRVCWEWFHRIYGNFILILGFVQVTLGVFLIVPPLGVWVAWIFILVGWVTNFFINYLVRIICCCCCKKGDKCNKCDEKEHLELKS